MVGIAQPDNFSIFIRKIGYSVGLENTLERFSDFCHQYISVPQIKQKDWLELVHNKWNLKTNNIADVFSSLGIVEVTQQGVFAGPIGEAGAICLKVLTGADEQRRAMKHLLALAILLSDGDIFLNCLAAQFRTENVRDSLRKMVIGKRQQLFEVFRTQAEKEAIAAAITIERQKTNKGGASKGGLNALRTGGLNSGLGKLGLPQPKDVFQMDPPSSDYLRHVLPARREWARTLGLVGESKDGGVTELGWQWLQVFGDAGFALPSGEYSLRPTRFELEKARLGSMPLLAEYAPSTWSYVRNVAMALGATECAAEISSEEPKILAETTKSMFELYREFAQDRRMVRNELPLQVALSTYMALCCSTGKRLVNYDSWLRSDASASFGIKTRTSRTIELGIIVT